MDDDKITCLYFYVRECNLRLVCCTAPFATDEAQQKLSNTNASISLVNLSNNTVLDAVIYSTRDDDETHKYKGFYRSSILTWAEEIVQAGAWNIADTIRGVFPSDGVNPKDSTR
jgi:hypothetical protein